ncbi:hypothetical protein [Streptomyces sp. CB03911]|uniref:hypothetical protein n=1 Tax=Streptomyces sp. CB03911 TaxID=1804758 RepID=UPI0018FE93D0|nr:hypothetical protein [Streptomyces sp. CB03911]
MTGYRLDLHIVEARPSVLGGALIDVTITDPGDDRPTLAARPVWEIWSDGVPTLPNQWAQFDAEGRSEWLRLTRVGPYGLQGLPGGTYHLDGQHVTDRTGLLLALGEALLGPGANYGTGLVGLRLRHHPRRPADLPRLPAHLPAPPRRHPHPGPARPLTRTIPGAVNPAPGQWNSRTEPQYLGAAAPPRPEGQRPLGSGP